MNYLLRLTTIIIVTILLVPLAAPKKASAQSPVLSKIIVTNTQTDLLIYLSIENAFNDDIRKVILSGVPTTFSYFVSLYEPRELWFDKKITERLVNYTIKYDSLKEVFTIIRSAGKTQPVTVKNIAAAEKIMTDLSRFNVISLSKLQKGMLYQLRVKAQLTKVTLPFNFQKILFFISLWDFETDWYTIDFTF